VSAARSRSSRSKAGAERDELHQARVVAGQSPVLLDRHDDHGVLSVLGDDLRAFALGALD
jgi:hypothetical protein